MTTSLLLRPPAVRAALRVACLCAITATFAGSAIAGTVAGRWQAQLTVDGVVIPFRLDLAISANDVTGTLFNGDEAQTTTRATLAGDELTLDFEHYLTRIVARVRDRRLEGSVEGRFEQDRYLSRHAFSAVPYTPSPRPKGLPAIDGEWLIPYESAKGEKAWRLIVRQRDADVTAAILRVDGDTGALTGGFEDGRFVLSHFDGQRPLRVELTTAADGSLRVVQSGPFSVPGALTAYRVTDPRTRSLPAPADFATHTSMRDFSEPFTFAFPDVSGRLRANDDPQFAGKVVLAVVTGTWCPNCHDEAQYLVQLHDMYADRGLEIVALDFEEPEQQDELARVKAFVAKYGVQYTYLIAGAPSEMWEKVPQAVNLNTWPATFFIGRDGRVKRVHAGFAGAASGLYHDQLEGEFTATIERLLAEQPPAARFDQSDGTELWHATHPW